jgi:predicted RNase H-like HicB family nuclease
MSTLHYSLLIQRSDEDQAYLVTLPEWEDRVLGPVTHGDTYEEALDTARRRWRP